MKLASFEWHGQPRLGAVLEGERILDFHAAAVGAEPSEIEALGDCLAFLEGGEPLMRMGREMAACAATGSCPREELLPLSSVRLRPPVPGARKLLALAGNYPQHIREGGRPTFPKEETYPYFFLKPASTTLVGTGDAVRYPRIGRKIDYEGELAVVIGERCRDVPAERAYEFIAGYTILNDISERGFAAKEGARAERDWDRFFDWLVGKWFDTAAPCGPWLVTRDEIPDPHALRLRTRVNGELRQDASTGEMIFSVPEIVAFISRVVTLEPGDLIATGTPSGVGNALGKLLAPGDTVEVEIDGIGVLRNRVTGGE